LKLWKNVSFVVGIVRQNAAVLWLVCPLSQRVIGLHIVSRFDSICSI